MMPLDCDELPMRTLTASVRPMNVNLDKDSQLAERMEEMRRSLYQTYTQLRELNQLKDEYLFSVAHRED